VLYSFGHSPALELTRINRRVNGMADTPPHSMHPMLSAAVKRGAAAVSAALADSPLRAASVGGKRGRYNGDDDDDDEVRARSEQRRARLPAVPFAPNARLLIAGRARARAASAPA
jgi:hypothetical protein